MNIQKKKKCWIIKSCWKYLAQKQIDSINLSCPFIPNNLEMCFQHKKGREFYWKLCKNNPRSSGKGIWNNFFEINDETWKHVYLTTFRVTSSSKLQWLQYRINQHILTTNSYLFKIGLTENPHCFQLDENFGNAEK